jgi:hypothetical protein
VMLSGRGLRKKTGPQSRRPAALAPALSRMVQGVPPFNSVVHWAGLLCRRG